MEQDLILAIIIAIYGPATIGWSLYWLIRRASAKRQETRLRKALGRERKRVRK